MDGRIDRIFKCLEAMDFEAAKEELLKLKSLLRASSGRESRAKGGT
jgi:hypothetical protein